MHEHNSEETVTVIVILNWISEWDSGCLWILKMKTLDLVFDLMYEETVPPPP
jgi:hypothetical protein